MIEIQKMGAQGDVVLRKVERVPDGYVGQNSEGPVVVAHSETGHHHTADGVRLFAGDDPLTCYLVMESVYSDVVHHRNYDTHATLRLLGKPGDVWEVRRQREWTPEGWRRVED